MDTFLRTVRGFSTGMSVPPPIEHTPQINEYGELMLATRELMDSLWLLGWRHFGPTFVRYSRSTVDVQVPRVVMPLRIILARFQPSRSHRRILGKLAGYEVRIIPARIDATRDTLFQLHKQRFTANPPPSLESYLGPHPGLAPCETLEIGIYSEGRLIAASYLDVGRKAVSSVYAMFHPDHAELSPGIATTLIEMSYARSRGCEIYYPGYAFHEASAFDYKKRFRGTEWFDWRGSWWPLDPAPSCP